VTEREQFSTIQLGPGGPKVRPLGIGTRTWGFGEDEATADRRDAFDVSLRAGVTLFDTAEVYALGKSERLLGSFIAGDEETAVVMTKYAPFPWRFGRRNVINALRASLKRLGLKRVDLYMIHWPYTQASVETLSQGLADAIDAGLTRTVGVSNFSTEQTQRAYDVLANRGVSLASNQVRYSLLHRSPETNGLLDLCHRLDVKLVAYGPLASGLLTGKYTPERPPTGFLAFRWGRRYVARLQPLLELMEEIGSAHGGKTAGQVALNWVIAKGAIPIPGAKNARQAEENVGALGWRLTETEINALCQAAQAVEGQE
jgi:aryl-alcohol dehydrogenase-like predicted oxidoreductase